MIIVDTREKKWDHIRNYFENSKIPYKNMKLDTGDYMNDSNPAVVVDRKQNLDEVLHNLMSKDDSRFWRELRRSKQEHIKLFLLVEHSRNINSLSDVVKFKSHWSRASGTDLAQKMYEVECAYKVKFVFCDKKHTAERILQLLCYDQRRST